MNEIKPCCGGKAPDNQPPARPPAFQTIRDIAGKYAPVIGVFGLAAAGALALESALDTGFTGWMHYAMGLGFLNFALLKMGDIPAFAVMFGKYDLLAGKSRAYGLIFPFIEAGLGLGYLAHGALPAAAQAGLYALTVLLMGLGAAGVARALKNSAGDLKCACVGGDKSLPLSTVALAENIAMGGMAALMLAQMTF